MGEIRSHELVTNEVRGREIIQAAANSQNTVALTHHEMDMISSLPRWWSKSTPSLTLPRATDSSTAPRPFSQALM